MPEHKCTFGGGTRKLPSSRTASQSLTPCLYQEIEAYKNVTVHILRCVRCGHIEVEWERQDNTIDISEGIE